MRRRFWRPLAWTLAAALVLALVAFASQSLRLSLERQARSLDLAPILAHAGLRGRVVKVGWDRTRFLLFPRPALALEGVDVQLLSGQPGSGTASGRLRVTSLRLVPGWEYFRRGTLDRIEADGGTLDLSSDLVPQLPRDYLDPLEGARRPVPWATLLTVTADSLDRASRPRLREALARFKRAWGPSGDVAPVVSVTNLEMRLATLDVLPGYSMTVRRARFNGSGKAVQVEGQLSVDRARASRLLIPLRFSREEPPGGGAWRWTAQMGRDEAGCQVSVIPGIGTNPTSWTIELHDPFGRLAGSLLEGRTGALTHLRWSGPWAMQSIGEGRFPAGLKETEISLLSGQLFLDDSPGRPVAEARGTLRILPGRVDFSGLSLRCGPAAADTARLRLEWLQTTRGKRIRGELAGMLDPAWLALAGSGWRAAGAIQCRLSFEGTQPGEGEPWELAPRGRIEGTLDSLRGPWFSQSLHDAHVSAWPDGHEAHLLLFGKWGSSPFRLEARGVPMPGANYVGRVADLGAWSFRSPWCRVEDFRLSSDRFPGAGETPFWLFFPGAGTVRIGRGSFGGVVFDSLSASIHTTMDAVGPALGLDSLVMRVGTGGLSALSAPLPASLGAGVRAGEPGYRLQASGLDLKTVRHLLEAGGLRFRAEMEGKLNGSGWLRLPRSWSDMRQGGEFAGSVSIVDGAVRGLPVQETIRQWAHLPQLATLSFRTWDAELRAGSAGLAFNRMRLDAPPLRLDGAGRYADGQLRAALLVRPSLGDGGALTDVLSALLGGSQAVVYTVVTGPWETPAVQLVTKAEFLKHLEKIGGSLAPGKLP